MRGLVQVAGSSGVMVESEPNNGVEEGTGGRRSESEENERIVIRKILNLG